MELENEKKMEEQTAQEQQKTTSHEGEQGQTRSGYQGYRPGRSPRPRIHQQTRPYNQGGFNRRESQDEGGFRPEGFGAGLQSGASQPREYGQPRNGYRPRTSYNQGEEFGQQPRNGYRPRP